MAYSYLAASGHSSGVQGTIVLVGMSRISDIPGRGPTPMLPYMSVSFRDLWETTCNNGQTKKSRLWERVRPKLASVSSERKSNGSLPWHASVISAPSHTNESIASHHMSRHMMVMKHHIAWDKNAKQSSHHGSAPRTEPGMNDIKG